MQRDTSLKSEPVPADTHQRGHVPPPRSTAVHPARRPNMLQNKNRKGFTLIELLIVVVIIGILAAIAIPKFSSTKEKAYVASEKADLKNLVNVQEAFYADSGRYAK